MRIHQIRLSRMTGQGFSSGGGISARSSDVSETMVKDFWSMYKGVEIGDEDFLYRSDVIQGYYDSEGKLFYLVKVIATKECDAARPSVTVCGCILEESIYESLLNMPDRFLSFSDECFCGVEQQGRDVEVYPELDELRLVDSFCFSEVAIRERLSLNDDLYRKIAYAFFETVINDVNLKIRTGKEFSFFNSIIRDMAYIAYSVFPAILRKRVTFSSYKLPGMLSTLLTLQEADKTIGSDEYWINLEDGLSGGFESNEIRNEYGGYYISTILKLKEEDRDKYLTDINRKMVSLVGDAKSSTIKRLEKALFVSFFTMNENIDSYAKKDNICSLIGLILEESYNDQTIVDQAMDKILSSLNTITLNKDKADAAADAPKNNEVDITVSEEKNNEFDYDNFFKSLEEYFQKRDSRDYERDFISALYGLDVDELGRELLKQAENCIVEYASSENAETNERNRGILKAHLVSLSKRDLIIAESAFDQLVIALKRDEQEAVIYRPMLQYVAKYILNADDNKKLEKYKNIVFDLECFGNGLKHDIDGELNAINCNIPDIYYSKIVFPVRKKELSSCAEIETEIGNVVREFVIHEKSEQLLAKLYDERFIYDAKVNFNSICQDIDTYARLNRDLYDTYKTCETELKRHYAEDEDRFESVKAELFMSCLACHGTYLVALNKGVNSQLGDIGNVSEKKRESVFNIQYSDLEKRIMYAEDTRDSFGEAMGEAVDSILKESFEKVQDETINGSSISGSGVTMSSGFNIEGETDGVQKDSEISDVHTSKEEDKFNFEQAEKSGGMSLIKNRSIIWKAMIAVLSIIILLAIIYMVMLFLNGEPETCVQKENVGNTTIIVVDFETEHD